MNLSFLLAPPGPLEWATIFLAIFLLLLAGLALAWRWFAAHREAIWNAFTRCRRSLTSSRIADRIRQRYPRAWRFLVTRLSREHYLGLHLTIGLVLSLGALIFFATVAEDVPDHGELAAFDDVVAATLRAHATPRGTAALRLVSALGGGLVLGVVGAFATALLAVRRKRVHVIGWLAALLGAAVLDNLLKSMFRRPRPEIALQVFRIESWSFPSGHAMASLIVYGMLAYVAFLFVRHSVARLAIVVGACVLILAIGFSRLYLGVHYFTDVIGGFAAGAVWLSVCISGVEVVRRRRPGGDGATAGGGG